MRKHKSKFKIVIIMLLSIEMLIIGTNYILNSKDNLYEIYIGEKAIGYLGDKQQVELVYNNVVEGIKDRLDNSDLEPDKIKFKKINNEVEVINKNELQNKILECVNIETALTNVMISGESFGIIAREEEGKDVLKKIGEMYIDNIDINRDNVISIDVKSNIEYEGVKAKVSNLSTIDDIAKEIFNRNKTKNIVDVSIKCREEKEVEVAPTTKIVNNDDMCIGEINEVEGTPGSKYVVSNVTYRNGVKLYENIIDEKTLVDAKDTIIYKGSKSPIDNKIAFLSHPTKGGYITSEFGSRWGKNHNGIDISHNIGDPVYASFDGLVKEASYKYSYGNKILLEHEGNLQTIYAHLSSFDVKVGDRVKVGDLIGRVGNTGNSTGSHLHFELRANGKPVNPKMHIKELS